MPLSAAAPAVTFTDIAASAGVRFVHNNGAFGKKYLPETMGSGALFLDFDARRLAGHPAGQSARTGPGAPGRAIAAGAYRNKRNGTFTNVTAAPVSTSSCTASARSAADYDNDGKIDIYLTALGGNRLFRNLGAGKFADVTQRAGVGDGGFSTSALWFDYDIDGKLDLFVAHYVEWSIEKDLHCTLDGKNKSYARRSLTRGRARRSSTTAATARSRTSPRRRAFAMPRRRGWAWRCSISTATAGWICSSPTTRSRTGCIATTATARSRIVAVGAGVAFSEAGVARAGMGVDAADYDGSGRPSLIIGNFSNQMMALYHNEGNGLFIDDAPQVAGRGGPRSCR